MKAALSIFAIAAALAMAGCGGNGQTPFVPDEGSYSGTWTSTALNDNGVMTLSIQPNGTATGTMTDVVQNATNGVVQGQVQNDGTFSGIVQYGSGGPMVIMGNLSANGSGHLGGTLTEYINGLGYSLTVDLPKS